MKAKDVNKILFEEKRKLNISRFEGVADVNRQLSFPAFFPYGRGFLDGGEKEVKYLFLGQDWGTKNDFESAREFNDKNPTWSNLRNLLREAGIDENECFFSNVFVGLRAEGSSVGDFAKGKPKEFEECSIEFLKKQIQTITPEVVFCLGKPAVKMLGKLFPDDLKDWKKGKGFKYYDDKNWSTIDHKNSKNLSFSAVILLHPSFRQVNLRYRSFAGYTENEAEVEMIKNAVRL